ncbi:MAG: hypothetical protein C4560_04200 [Nitrospiraceae bacterium]|nr:MAG: hypothetical protein C4560_04200 [Nitrospiraceae bacterium]
MPQDSRQTYFYRLGSRAVIEAFKEKGLEVVEVTPGLTIGAVAAKESVIFLLPSYGSDIGGVVSAYDSEDKLDESAGYYSSMNKDPGPPAWRIFRKGNILLLISGRVSEEKAREYERVLKEMGEK